MENTMKTRVSKYNPLTQKPPPRDKRPGLDTGICFYNVNGDDKSDMVDVAAILVKIYKGIPVTKNPYKN